MQLSNITGPPVSPQKAVESTTDNWDLFVSRPNCDTFQCLDQTCFCFAVRPITETYVGPYVRYDKG